MEALCRLSGLDPFWDWNLTWYTERPDLTQCFQHTVLVWSPCIYLWTCSPLYLLYLQLRSPGPRLALSSLCCVKTAIAVILLCCRLVELLYIYALNEDIHHNVVFLLGPLFRIISLVLAVCVIQVERLKGVFSSILLFFFWLLSVLCSLLPLKVAVEQIMDQSFSSDPVRFTVLLLVVLLQFLQIILACFSDYQPDSQSRPTPGCRSPLQAWDLWALRPQDCSTHIMEEVEKTWAERHKETSMSMEWSAAFSEKSRLLQREQSRADLRLLLLRMTARSFGLYFLCGSVCLLLHDVAMFTVPQVLSLLLDFMRDSSSPLWKGLLFAALLFLLSCLQSLLFHQYMYHCFTVGMRLKTALTGLIYRKCLVMSSGGRRQCAAGEVISLVSADVQKLMDLVVYINSIWTAPFEIALCFYFLWLLLGPSALAGLAAVLLLFPLNGYITTVRAKLQEVQLGYLDGRIKLMTEMLSGMKILKFYAWEQVFQRRVGALRDGELAALKKSQILYCVSLASFASSSFLVMLTVFGVYVLVDEHNVLDAQKIFVSAALINILKTPLSQLPFAISTAAQAVVSLRRLTSFLQQDEVKGDSVCRLPHSTDAPAIEVHAGYFSWSTDAAPVLSSINVMVERGSLVAVVGPVGSGKSSLLAAILGEMERSSGSAKTRVSAFGQTGADIWTRPISCFRM
uniref:ABC transmembrane type-1 domain-containing protein n=1 Tax=Knipowitschia caucasica TaxID=637954 RepID=A0AAV2LK27_KNICA